MAENTCFESMGFSPHDFSTGSVLGIEDGFFSLNQLVDSYDHFFQAPSSSSLFACSGSVPMEIAQSLFSELEKQRVEMDWFLQLENKRLRRYVLEEFKRQQAALILKHESRMNSLMLHKDEELTAARSKAAELQHLIRAAEVESRAWEKKAAEREAVVSALQDRLSRAMKNKKQNPEAPEDETTSFCESSSSPTGGGEDKRMGGCCGLCQQGRSLCVVFFPCRHLCCCNSCEPILGHCPVCQAVKEASIEVFLD